MSPIVWIKDSIQKFFPIPGWCFGCQAFLPQAQKPWLCPDCIEKLPHWLEGICLSCGHYHNLGDCEEDWTLVLDHFNSIFAYLDPIKEWLARFKYGSNLNGGRILKALVAEYLRLHPKLLLGIDLVYAVPSHHEKLVKRGFNAPAYLLDGLGVPMATTGVKKIKMTHSQAGLHSIDRARNLNKAFWADPKIVEGKKNHAL